jgi:hypothetical protein
MYRILSILIVTAVIVFLLRSLRFKRCPHCRKLVRSDATACPHCTRDL